MDETVPLTVPELDCNSKMLPLLSSVVKKVPLPVTVVDPLVKEAVPVQ